MTAPGPTQLGRSVVVGPGGAVPGPWAGDPVVVVDEEALREPGAVIERLHRAWVEREPVVIELGVDAGALRSPESETRAPHDVGARFTFGGERLHFLVWANSYDARTGSSKWWWGEKAQAVGAQPGGAADVILPGGAEAWVDGGPRGPLPALGARVVPAESVSLGRLGEASVAPEAVPDLAPDQAAAARHGSGPARIIAPAGSGKTRTLTARLEHLLDGWQVEPDLLCALAYNTRAAAEMRERLDHRPGVRVRTIHSLGWEILREARGEVRLLDDREVRARLDPLVAAPRRPNTDIVGPYVEALGDVRIALRSPQAVEGERDDVPGFPESFARYRSRLAERGEADFDEQVYGAIEALLTDPVLRSRWQDRCRHLLVDEFQDLTAGYLLLIRLVASPQLDVFGVGDDDQTIYGYAGADPGFLIDYGSLFPGAKAHALRTNYRCPVPVVTAAATLLRYNDRRIPKEIEAAPDAVDDQMSLSIERLPADEMAAGAGKRLTTWLDLSAPRQIAVLARVNSALLPVQAALADAGVAFSSPLGEDLMRRTVTAAALAWMRLGLDPDQMDRQDLLAAARRPSRGINRLAGDLLRSRRTYDLEAVTAAGAELDGRQAVRWDRFVEDIGRVTKAAGGGDAGAVLDAIIDGVGLDASAHALDRGRSRPDRAAQYDDIIALRRAAAVHPQASSFEAWLRDVLATPADPAGVLLSTIHRAKGLEWDRVLVFGVDRGLLPHDLADDWEEERRILHVALTRCRRQVTMLADAARPSPFLDELTGAAPRPAAMSPEPPRPPPRKRRGAEVSVGDRIGVPGGLHGRVEEIDADGAWVAVTGGALVQARWGEDIMVGGSRRPLTPPTGGLAADEGLVEALKAWRRETAAERSVPAYVVLHDATLETIAAIRPHDEASLAAVPGIGPAKLEAYGDAIIDLCSR